MYVSKRNMASCAEYNCLSSSICSSKANLPTLSPGPSFGKAIEIYFIPTDFVPASLYAVAALDELKNAARINTSTSTISMGMKSESLSAVN